MDLDAIKALAVQCERMMADAVQKAEKRQQSAKKFRGKFDEEAWKVKKAEYNRIYWQRKQEKKRSSVAATK
jgi:hypothetical protein